MAEEDLIFGKNRHFFGGIEPSNMLEFSATMGGNGKVRITANLPKDTVVDGQTLCTVGGAVIRKRIDNYPVDEFDGEEVANVTADGTISDTNTTENGTYYYSAFPYTKQGVYNRNVANRTVVNEPAPLTSFTAVSKYISTPTSDKVQITITAELPSGIEGVEIRKGTSGFPVDEKDGERLTTMTVSGTFIDENVVLGNTYYYTAFPYTSTKAYNRSESNRASATAAKYGWFYGYDLDTTEDDPELRVKYPTGEGLMNETYTTGLKFNDDGYPIADSKGWNIKEMTSFPAGKSFMPSPCMLKYDGTVDYFLDPNDYTKKQDGTASDISDLGYSGNAMMQWPKIYTKRWQGEDGIYHFRCSDTKIDDSYECWCNYDANDKEIPYFYTSIYRAHVYNNKARSISGCGAAKGLASVKMDKAKENGSGWNTGVVADHLLIQDLLVLLGKSTNGEAVYGEGYDATNFTSSSAGNTKGMFYKPDSTHPDQHKVFGMVYPWSFFGLFLSGLLHSKGKYLVKITEGTHDGSASVGYNLDGTGYSSFDGFKGLYSPFYINTMTWHFFGRLPAPSVSAYTSGGSYFECDSCSIDDATDTLVPSVGYHSFTSNYLRMVGPFRLEFEKKPNESNDTEFTISCKPLVK